VTREPKNRFSPREREVVALLTEGYSFQEIGELLHISVKTVDTHKYNAMRKIGAKRRVELFQSLREERAN